MVEIIHQAQGIKVFYIKAKSFPEGINESPEEIHHLARRLREENFLGSQGRNRRYHLPGSYRENGARRE